MAQEFATGVQQARYALVEEQLREADIEFAAHDEAPLLQILFADGPIVSISVEPWDADTTLVRLDAYLLRRPRTGQQQLRQLLQENLELVLGHYAIDPDGDLVVTHSFTQQELPGAELVEALQILGGVALSEGPRLAEEIGGELLFEPQEGDQVD